MRVGVADALSGVARVEVRLAGAALETRLAADGRAGVAGCRPAASDGAAVAVRVLDASTPANVSERSATLPVRSLPVLRSLRVARGLVTGRLAAPGVARVTVRAYPKGSEPHVVGTARCAATARSRCASTRPHDALRRGGAAEPDVPRTGGARGRPAARDARIEALQVRVRGDRLVVSARFEGRGEATRLHLLVHDVRGARWVEGCLEHGKPGDRLEQNGSVTGTSRIPPSARASLDVPAGARGAVQHVAVAHAVERVAQPAPPALVTSAGPLTPRATPVKAAIGAARTGRRACRSDWSLSGSCGPQASPSTPAEEPSA